MSVKLKVTYYNYDTDLDRKIFKIVNKVEKHKTFSGMDGGRSLIYVFSTEKAVSMVKKNLKDNLPEDCNIKFSVVK